MDELYQLCGRKQKYLPFHLFQSDLHVLAEDGELVMDAGLAYLPAIHSCENRAAERLSVLLLDNNREPPLLPVSITAEGIPLCSEQRIAVETALSHRLSMILGGAGTGKTSIIRAIYDYSDATNVILCAPTGKAARNLTQRAGLPACTIHNLLSIHESVSFLDADPIDTGLVIVDEASMLSLDMLAGLLTALPEDGSLVLLGDPTNCCL